MADIGSEISQIIFLGTGFQATDAQINAWTAAVDNGASIDDVANAFVASDAFAASYNGGVPVDPNSAPTVTLTQEIIDHSLFSYSASQVSAWVNSGETIGQVFEAFALNDNWATYTATYYSGGDSSTFSDGADTTDIVNFNLSINIAASPISTAQVIELATGTTPTQSQVGAWEGYQAAGGSFASMVSVFVGSTAFADTYNNGATVDPNAPVTFAIAQGIIEHAAGSVTDAQVDAWVATGLSVAQVFQDFALGDQFAASQAPQNAALFPTLTEAYSGPTFTLNGLTTFTDTGYLTEGTTGGGTTTSEFFMTTLSGAVVGDDIIFNNTANEVLANLGGGSAEVNVSAVGSLPQALDLATADATASQPGQLLPGQTGVIDWFQYGGNTYIVEAVNPTASPEDQTALAPSDAVIKLVGIVDLTNAHMIAAGIVSTHILTL